MPEEFYRFQGPSSFGDYYIPKRMEPSILAYVNDGRLPGDFLTAVLCNDLEEACKRADGENLRNLPAFVAYFHNEIPGNIWGSREKVTRYVEAKHKERALFGTIAGAQTA